MTKVISDRECDTSVKLDIARLVEILKEVVHSIQIPSFYTLGRNFLHSRVLRDQKPFKRVEDDSITGPTSSIQSTKAGRQDSRCSPSAVPWPVELAQMDTNSYEFTTGRRL